MSSEALSTPPAFASLPPPRARQAVLLVGGKGARLKELTRVTPKPLMSIGEDRVFLDLLIDNVARQGFDRILLLAGHFGEQIVARYDGRRIGGAMIAVAVEPEPLGTGGGLRWSRDRLDDVFLLANGDTYFDMAYRSLEPALRDAPGALAAMALRRVGDAARYGSVRLDGLRVTGFREKIASVEAEGEGTINAGVYLMRRAMVDLIAEGPVSLETRIFPELVERGALVGTVRDGYFIDIGQPETLSKARSDLPAMLRRPALFLDRDGVINVDRGYAHRWDQIEMLAGVAETVAAFNDAGWFVFVVTNQAGVARGYYEEAAIELLHERMRDWLAERGAHVDAFYYCPFHPQGSVEAYRLDHPDRKPRPGMLLRAMAEWPVDSTRAFLVGDKDSDLAAATAAGIPGYLFSGGDLSAFFDAQRLWPQVVREPFADGSREAERNAPCSG